MHAAIKRLRRAILYHGIKGLMTTARSVPDAVAFGVLPGLGEPLARLVCRNAPITENLRRAFSEELDEVGIRRLAADYHRHVCRRAVETMRLGCCSRDQLLEATEVVGLEYLEAARAERRGVIIIGGHVGNWEVAGAALAQRGLPISVVSRAQRHRDLQDYLTAMRQRHGLRIIPHPSPLGCYRCLREQGLLVLLIDMTAREGGVMVPFFGHPAASTVGPAVLGLKTGAPVIPMSAQRLPDRARPGHGYRHRIVIEPPLPLSRTGDHERDIVENTARFQQAVEAGIRRAPAQWIWLYPRWETRNVRPRPSPATPASRSL